MDDEVYGEIAKALGLWRSTRHPALAHVVRRLSERVPMTNPLRGGKTRADIEAWDAVEAQRRPEDLPALLASALGSSELHDRERPGADLATSRVERLVARGPDPRVTEAVKEWAAAFHYTSQRMSHPWFKLVGTVLTEHVEPGFDPAVLADQAVERLAGGFASAKRLAVAGWIRKLAPTPPDPKPLTEAQHAQLDAWLAEVGPPATEAPPASTGAATEEELLEAIYADPDDEGLRHVYADLLQERGSPRAAFEASGASRRARRSWRAPRMERQTRRGGRGVRIRGRRRGGMTHVGDSPDKI